MAIYTFVNAIGLHLLRFIVNLGITAEIIATLFLGTLLVLFFRHHSPSILVHNQGAVHPGKAVPAAFAALAYGGWVLFGFDACGAVAEETQNPKERVPRATIWSLAIVGVIDLIVIAGLMLSQPDLKGAVNGTVADPISAPVTAALGSWSTKPFLAIVVIGFISCGIAVQAASVRVIYSFARDDMLPLSSLWRRVTVKSSVPMYAVIGTGVLASLIFLYGKVLAVLVGFATGAIYLSYLAAVAGLVYLKAPPALASGHDALQPRPRRLRHQPRRRALAHLRVHQHRLAAHREPALVRELGHGRRHRHPRGRRRRVLPGARVRTASSPPPGSHGDALGADAGGQRGLSSTGRPAWRRRASG